MAYIKHPEHGNKHVPDEELEAHQSQGWVKWPRTAEQKAGFPFVVGSARAPEPASDVPAKRKYTRKA